MWPSRRYTIYFTNLKAIILAGGLGTRLREKVPLLPKPMAPVAGRPFLEYVLDRLIAGGISEITLSVGYRADSIMEHFGSTYNNVVINYAIESEPLGTGGAIVNALGKLDKDPVLILNGDTYLNIDYRDVVEWYRQLKPKVAIVLKEMPDVARYGSVFVSNKLICGFSEKNETGPGLINAGVYIINPAIFTDLGLSGKFSFEVDVLQRYYKELSPIAFCTNEYFIDIGIPDDYIRAQHELPTIS